MEVAKYLPTQDSATGRGLKTAFQAFFGFVIGLLAVIWAVPTVPETVYSYLIHNWMTFALAVGLPSGIISFIMNALRPDVKNYN